MSTLEAGKNPRDIILKPVVTEKSSILMDEGKYTFEVDPRANKTEIKIAIEEIFGVKVGQVATRTVRARPTGPARVRASARTSSEQS